EKHQIEKNDYEGFHTRPMSWETVISKFEGLAEPYATDDVQKQIVDMVQNFEQHSVNELMKLLSEVGLAVNVSLKNVSINCNEFAHSKSQTKTLILWLKKKHLTF